MLRPLQLNALFFKGGCTIRTWRPFDCRSYPIYVKYSKDCLEFYVDTDCRLHAEAVSGDFLKKCVNAWEILAAALPKSFWKKYSDFERDVEKKTEKSTEFSFKIVRHR